jgi:hypothetical protein
MDIPKIVPTETKLNRGVPQGSILGPLFFLLYNNDLPYILNNVSKLTLFADDTSLIFSNSNSTDYVTFIVTFDKMNLWFTINSLSLNLFKTNYVHFTAKSNIKIDINIKFKDIQINNTYNIKYLGLTIDNTLSWKK